MNSLKSKLFFYSFLLLLSLLVSSCSTEVSEGSGSEVGNAITVSINQPEQEVSNIQVSLLPINYVNTDSLELNNSDSTFHSQVTLDQAFQIEGLKSGEYRITLTAIGSKDSVQYGYSTRASLLSTSHLDLKILLQQNSYLEGKLDSTLYSSYSDLIAHIQGTHSIAKVSPKGEFSFENTPSGEHYKISVFSKKNMHFQNQSHAFNLTPSTTQLAPTPLITKDFPQNLNLWDYQQRFQINWNQLSFSSFSPKPLSLPIKLNDLNIDFNLIDPTNYHFRVLNNLGEIIPSRISYQDYLNEALTLHIYPNSLASSLNDTLTLLWDSTPQPTADFTTYIFPQDSHVVTWDFNESIEVISTPYTGLNFELDPNLQALGGNNNLTSTPTQEPGIIDYSQSFDGVDDFIQVQASSPINFDSIFSIQFWTKLDFSPDYNQRISYREANLDIKEVQGSIQFACGPAYQLSTEKITEHEWTQITITGDLSLKKPNISIYINGVKTTPREDTFASSYSDYTRKFNSDLFIGSLDATSFLLMGNISNYQIWSYMLSEEQIKQQFEITQNLNTLWTTID